MLKSICEYGFPILFAVMGLIAFAAYGKDKSAARKKKRRIPEKTLFLLNLTGGFLGGWIGMYSFRHKTKHKSFYAVQFISALIWLCAWGFAMEYTK